MAQDKNISTDSPDDHYSGLVGNVVDLLKEARQNSVRAVNSIMTATYWEVGRRIVEFEQGGEERAAYGKGLLKQLSKDLTGQCGKGFSRANLEYMRKFYLLWSDPQRLPPSRGGKPQTPSGISESPKSQTLSGKSENTEETGLSADSEGQTDSHSLNTLATAFPLPWSHYVRLLKVDNKDAREFYESEALRGGWSVRQLDRQVGSLFYERTAMSTNKEKMLTGGGEPREGEVLAPEQQLKDPLVLEFLGLKDEYSESDLEEAIILKLEEFLLELGSDFAFVGRQKRLRIGDHWFRVDLLFFHRRLRCLVVIDLKIGEFSHADAGQMHMYLNYAAEHWTNEDENPPVGIILCAKKDDAVAHYALEGLPNQVMASEYRLALPDEKVLVNELKKAQKAIESRSDKLDINSNTD